MLAAKSDSVRKGKLEKDLKKVDVRNLEIRSSKPAKNSQRELVMTKTRRSVRRPTRAPKPEPIHRSRSANRMEIDEEAFDTHSARI